MKNIITHMNELYSEFTEKQKQLANYINKNYRKVAFMTSSNLANEAKVSGATVIRFANFLGFENYAHFQVELQKLVFNSFSSIDEMNNLHSKTGDNATYKKIQDSIQTLSNNFNQQDRQGLELSSLLISSKEYVFLSGFQMSQLFVSYTDYLLSKYKTSVYTIDSINLKNEDLIQSNCEKSCAIIFALQRYPNKTLEMVEYYYQKGIPIILFTDSNLFPYLDKATYVITIQSGSQYDYFGSFLTVFTFIYELILMIIDKDKDNVIQNLERFETFADKYKIYYEIGVNKQDHYK